MTVPLVQVISGQLQWWKEFRGFKWHRDGGFASGLEMVGFANVALVSVGLFVLCQEAETYIVQRLGFG